MSRKTCIILVAVSSVCVLLLAALLFVFAQMNTDNIEASQPMVTGSQPVKTITVPPVHHNKPAVTFIATGDVGTVTCAIEGVDKSCFPQSHTSYPLNPDRMATYAMSAQLHNQPGDSVTISIKIHGKVIGSVTASSAHQIASITVYRNHPHGPWVAVPSYS